MSINKVKPVGFLSSFTGHKYVAACYHFLRLWLLELHLVNCGTHEPNHPKESSYRRKLESAGFVKDYRWQNKLL